MRYTGDGSKRHDFIHAPRTRKIASGIVAARILRGDQSMLSVSGLDHLKVRVASAGASAMFYYSLFGGDLVPL
ncbi:MAG TPA: hypothetical protein VME43_23475, partial [Bryobacteraceae bacterium]|nr:hypothetical protein [Bryobacteraceae bacterium]